MAPTQRLSPDSRAWRRRCPSPGSPPSACWRCSTRRARPRPSARPGPRFFGFVIGGSLPATVAASILATAWDQNAGAARHVAGGRRPRGRRASRGCSTCSRLPHGTGVGFVTCATTANQSGLAAARHALLARQGWNVEAQGLFGAPAAARGRGRRGARERAEGAHAARPRPRARASGSRWTARAGCAPTRCRRSTSATIVCLQAGNVNTGAFDPAAARSSTRARAARRLGARGRRLRAVGARRAVARATRGGARGRRLLGHRRPQVAERALRQRPRLRAATRATLHAAMRAPPRPT